MHLDDLQVVEPFLEEWDGEKLRRVEEPWENGVTPCALPVRRARVVVMGKRAVARRVGIQFGEGVGDDATILDEFGVGHGEPREEAGAAVAEAREHEIVDVLRRQLTERSRKECLYQARTPEGEIVANGEPEAAGRTKRGIVALVDRARDKREVSGHGEVVAEVKDGQKL